MNLEQALDTYCEAQKLFGTRMMLLGCGLMTFAVYLHFVEDGRLYDGMKITALIIGLLMVLGGAFYHSYCIRLQEKQTQLLQEDATRFKSEEVVRMAKVEKEFPIYQWVFGAILIAAVLLRLLGPSSYWHGMAYSILILMTLQMILESISKISIDAYLESLKSL
ncbi:MAG: hypothetical protein GC180_02805 [Bacteroidetes bacterium]|nr:hypothetical protein [Bacteroidota bacterium]